MEIGRDLVSHKRQFIDTPCDGKYFDKMITQDKRIEHFTSSAQKIEQ
jgi:hypothetical protein